MRRFFYLLAGLFSLCAPSADAAAPDCDVAAARENVQLAQIDGRLDLTLADGRTVYFPTIEPPRATPAAADRPREIAAELTALLSGKSLLLLPLGSPDRWGRAPARLFVEGESESADETLVASGLVMASADPGACGADVLAAEQAARAARLGLWTDSAFALLSPDDPTSFFARSGTLAVVEGQIRSIGQTRTRLYLNFAARRGGLSLFIARKNLPTFERAGFSDKTLANRRIRARGVVEIGAAHFIELFHPGQIEFMEKEAGANERASADSPGLK